MKKITSIFFALFISLFVAAQVTEDEEYTTETKKTKEDKEKKDFDLREKLVYGGNVGLWFGGNSRFVQVNPMVGYKVTDWWAAGVGFNYTYLGNQSNNFSYYGPTLWTRIRPLEGFYLHTEYNYLRASYYNGSIPVWLVGGGVYSQGNVLSIGFFLLYDVIQHEQSPYRGGLVPQGGLLIGF